MLKVRLHWRQKGKLECDFKNMSKHKSIRNSFPRIRFLSVWTTPKCNYMSLIANINMKQTIKVKITAMHRLSIQYTNVKAASVENYGVFMKLTNQELLTIRMRNICRLKAYSHREKAEPNAKYINEKKTKHHRSFSLSPPLSFCVNEP